MFYDQYGCSLSTKNPEVVQIVDQFSLELLRLGKNMGCILDGVEKFPDEAILQIYAAIFYLYGQTEETYRKAAEHLEKASLLVHQANEREKNLFSVAWHWVNHLLADALKDIERHCFKWSKDLTALKLAEFLLYCKGLKYEKRRFLRLTTQCFNDNQHNPYFLPIQALALGLNSKYEESIQTAEKALQLNKENPWAHLALAHVYLNKGLIDQGIKRLEEFSPMWGQFHPIIESHNFWHLALLYLENDNIDEAERIYQRADWAQRTQFVSQQIDAASLLWRLDAEGRAHPELWTQLADAVGDNANFWGTPFLSAQLCFVLKKGAKKEKLERALVKIETLAHEQVKEDRFVWRQVGMPLIYGSLAYADHDFVKALDYFKPIMDTIGCVGGSETQVSLFTQTYLKSLIGAHQAGEAEALLHLMTQGRNLTKLERKWLQDCHGNTLPLERTG